MLKQDILNQKAPILSKILTSWLIYHANIVTYTFLGLWTLAVVNELRADTLRD